MGKHIPLKDLTAYHLARALSSRSRETYKAMGWKDQKIMGDHFFRAIGSFGAIMAKGYGRYHFLDKGKFYLKTRASSAEFGEHWPELLPEREKVKDNDFENLKTLLKNLQIKLNHFITTPRNSN